MWSLPYCPSYSITFWQPRRVKNVDTHDVSRFDTLCHDVSYGHHVVSRVRHVCSRPKASTFQNVAERGGLERDTMTRALGCVWLRAREVSILSISMICKT